MKNLSPDNRRLTQTELVQPMEPGTAAFRGALPPVHRTATVFMRNVEALRQCDWRDGESYSYGREGTPTTRELERRIAGIEGAAHALVAPSGLAAFCITCIALLGAGDEVALPANGYGSARQMVQGILRRFGVVERLYEPLAPDSWRDAIGTKTKLVWIEAPGSISLEVPDIQALVSLAREMGAMTAIDNTYSAGLHLQPFALGIDVSIQALTKLQSGGSDVILGSASCASDDVREKLCAARHFLGMNVSPDDAYLVLRGLPTLRMRYAHGGDSAAAVARWFAGREGVRRVMFPPLEDSPGHHHWKKYFTGAAGLFSIALRAPSADAAAFVDALKLFRIGYSWGGAVSLVMLYDEHHPAVQRLIDADAQIQCVIRLWIGLEEPHDLLADIEQAWVKASALRPWCR